MSERLLLTLNYLVRAFFGAAFTTWPNWLGAEFNADSTLFSRFVKASLAVARTWLKFCIAVLNAEVKALTNASEPAGAFEGED